MGAEPVRAPARHFLPLIAAGLMLFGASGTAPAQSTPAFDLEATSRLTLVADRDNLRRLGRPETPGEIATLTGGRVGEIQMRLTVAPNSAVAKLLELSGAETHLHLFPGEDGTGLLLMTNDQELTVGVDSFKPGMSADVLLRREPVPAAQATPQLPAEQWVIYLDGKKAGALPPGEAIPAADEQLYLALGTPRDPTNPTVNFSGMIERFALRTPEKLAYAHLMGDGGLLVRRALPEIGAHIVSGGDTAQRRAKIEGLTPADHGIFEKTVYYAVSPAPAQGNGSRGIALTVDWGGGYRLVPDQTDPDRYVPAEPSKAWAGSLTFEDADPVTGRRARFLASGVRTNGLYPFLENGKHYERAPGKPVGRGFTPSTFDSTTGIPNFYFSVMACYDVSEMSLVNMQDRGCAERPIFAFEQDSRDQGVLKNVPFGWKYIPFNAQHSIATSSLIESSSDLSESYSGSNGMGFTALGFTHKSNRESEEEYATLADSESILKLEQMFKTESHLVLVPDEVTLDLCFIHAVMRASATLIAGNRRIADIPFDERPTPPPYYDARAAEATCRDGAFDEPLSAQALVALYGSHYAHATTYGARALTRTRIKKDIFRQMAEQRHDISTKNGFETSLERFGVKEKVGIEFEDGRGSGKGSEFGGTTEDVSSATECYGGVSGCSSLDISIGPEPVPVYLDLRRFDQLLAAPFFTDLTTLTRLRPLVAAAIERRLMANPPSVIPSVLRMVDVGIADYGCSFGVANPDGSLPPYWGFLRDVCAQFPDHAVVGAMARYADGTERPLSLAQTIVWQGDQDFWKDPPANTNYWPHMPPLGAMTACFDASGKPLFGTSAPACQRRSFRLLVEPRMDGKSPAGKLVFKLFPRPDLSYADRATYACADDCATRYDYMVDFEGGRQRTYVTFMFQGDNELKRRLIPKPLELGLGDAVPSTLKGQMASHKDGMSTLLTADVTFAMKEVDLAGVLGFKETYDRAENVPPPDLATLAPAYQLRLENRGAYLARYQISFTQIIWDPTGQPKSFRPTQTSGAVAAMQSVTFPVPATATDVELRAEIVGTGREIFRRALGVVAGDGCLRTTGTLFGASVSGC